MKLQVLVSTMHQVDYSLLAQMKLQSDAIIVNQCDKEQIEDIQMGDSRITWISTKERGLSCSRNMAIRNATADICILADDDIEFVGDYENVILSQFERYPGADILTFQVEGIERPFKRYSTQSRQLNHLTSMKVSSVEIAFRLDSVLGAGITFDERFGAGAQYRMGEENIFLFECLRKGLTIRSVPIKIADLHVGESSWFEGYTNRYFEDLGAVYAAMSEIGSYFLIAQFAVRKYTLYRKECGLPSALRNMLNGRRRFRRENCVSASDKNEK